MLSNQVVIMNNKNIFLIAYDISDNKKRNKIAKLLERAGYERIQYSVFTGLTSPRKNADLWSRLEKTADIVQFPENKIFSFAISITALQNMKTIGKFNADIDYLTGDKHTEIF